MIVPTIAPPIAPAIDTVRMRCPSHATSALIAMATGSVDNIAARDASIAAGEISVAIHKANPAVAGTETLSSSRTGMVSTNAATIAATTGAMTTNARDGCGVIDGRVHHANATPPIAPHAMNAVVPATVLSRFHGTDPARNAKSPKAAEPFFIGDF